MKKYAFMVYHKEFDLFLSRLQDLGVIHIQENRSVNEDLDLQTILSQRKRIKDILRDFDKLNGKDEVQLAPGRSLSKEEGLELLRKLEELQERKAQLQTSVATLEKEIDYMKIWGDFSYADLKRLKEAGYKVTFFTSPSSKFDPEWIELYNATEINNIQSVSYFVTVTPVDTILNIDAERPKMPDSGLSSLQSRYDQLKKNLAATDDELKQKAASEYKSLEELDKILQNEFNLSNVKIQTEQEADNKLMLLEGWVPAESAHIMEAELTEEGYFFEPLEIQEEDSVPIKLKNNKFSRLYEPITRLYSLPNYTEFDPTPFFAPFFMLFFGLCFGDGGYGLLLILACTYFKFKVNPEYKPFLTLGQLFGLSAVIIGTLTGSFFGVSLIEVPALVAVKDYFLTSDNLMTLSIIIGLIQITFAKIIAAYKIKVVKGTKFSIAPFAWIFVIVFGLMIFGLPMLDVHLPDNVVFVFYGITAIALLVALLYNSPGKNVFVNFGSGLWAMYNTASGLLGDTLSYIRLFAIGLTGSILGGVFNTLAIDMTETLPIVAKVPSMLLILLFGHSINFALCSISALVHPLRLVFVEYYKNAEFEGGGKTYSPFRRV